MGFLDGLLGKPALKLERTPEGPRITDTRSGLGFVAPGEGQLIDGFPASPVSPAFDGGFRLAKHPVEVRLRLESVRIAPGAPPPAPGGPPPPIPAATPELAHDICAYLSDLRTPGEPLVGVAQAWQLEEWRVAGAASAIYPLAKAEGKFDMEECHVLVKAAEPQPVATILWKLFSSEKVSPELWSDLNGRLNATLAWGGDPRDAAPRTPSFYVEGDMALAPAARDEARRAARELKGAGVDANAVLEAAAQVQKLAYGSDPPDAALDAEVRSLLPPALLDAIGAPPLRGLVERELASRVKTFRDFRGLHVWLVEVAREIT